MENYMVQQQKFNEELWNEIPPYAFVALGRRGREEIQLEQCFIPKCNNNSSSKLHPIKKELEIIKGGQEKYTLERSKYLIYCDKCQHSFNLIFEKHFNTENTNSEINTIIERVYASNEDNSENYGEIGFIQPK